MFQRVLWVSLTQAIRSVALILLPAAFISLFAWATAGSSNGNTSDPVRVAMWIWLGAHHIPFRLLLPPAGQPGFFSFLPLGALLFPFLAARAGFIGIKNHLDVGERPLRLARISFTIFYTLIAVLIAWGSRTAAVTPILFWIPITTLPGIWFATKTVRIGPRKSGTSSVQIGVRIISFLLGISALLLGMSLFFHLKTLENLALVLQLGWLGGILFLLLNILYLPNAIVATLSYFAGTGFAVGAHTLLSPLTHTISEIPALPILGALPTGRHPLALYAIVIFVLTGMVLYRWTIGHNVRVLILSYLSILIGIAVIAYFSSGSLLTDAMSTVGVSPGRFTAAIGIEIGVGVVLASTVPRLFGKLWGRRQ